MFDPFGDFETRGYLRNTQREKDPDLIKVAEHALYRAHLGEALQCLRGQRRLTYAHFLQVHRILFGALYPWAGQDRAQVLPGAAVKKGSVIFSHPYDCEAAIEEGLRWAQDRGQMAARPGFIMGMFAYGHPFLDGNGRTMLLVHAELCARAQMSIAWEHTRKADYLRALTQEIEDPHGGHLDRYLAPFVGLPIPPGQWTRLLGEMPGLDGAANPDDEGVPYDQPGMADDQLAFEQRRGYQL